MATYAIGDIQGCFRTFRRLLRRISFGRRDHLWLVGDLVNRGPRSLDVLRFCTDLSGRATIVLGNHELHLLSLAAGVSTLRDEDTVQDVLEAHDRDALVDWIATRPLLHRDRRFVLVHAGLHPDWSLLEASRWANRASAELRGPTRARFLQDLRTSTDVPWRFRMSPRKRLVQATRVMTRVRMLDARGRLAKWSGPPDSAPDGCTAWFDLPTRRRRGTTVVFGHWAALGLEVAPGLLGLDTGCVWGGALTAVRLSDGAIHQERNRDEIPSG